MNANIFSSEPASLARLEGALLVAPTGTRLRLASYRTDKGAVFDYMLSMDGHDTYPRILKAQEAFYQQIAECPSERDLPAWCGAGVKEAAAAALKKQREKAAAYKADVKAQDEAARHHPHVRRSANGDLNLRNVRVVECRQKEGPAGDPAGPAELLQIMSPLGREFVFSLSFKPGKFAEIEVIPP